MSYQRRTTCRLCGETSLRAFLDFGPMPLANAFLRTTQDFAGERAYPLQACLCDGCGFVQTPDVVDAVTLFEHGPYLTGVSREMVAHFRALARRVVERLGLVPGDRVIEVGSNDGTLLECFRGEGVLVLGVEPARPAAEAARRRGIETVERFFDQPVAGSLRHDRGGARAVIACNVLAHVDRPLEFLAACRTLVEGVAGGSGSGEVVVEVPWLGDLLERLEYDTIYHEHLGYFSATALLRLFWEAGFAVDHLEHVPVHGGSLRAWASLRKGPRSHAESASEWTDRERVLGLASFERLERFAGEVEENRKALVRLLKTLKKGGASIAACGAPAKSTTLLNHARIDTGLVAFTVDRNPVKVGALTPGMHLPVLAVAALEERRPDYALLLAWNLEDEMREQHAGWLAKGGKLIRPIPRPEVLP